MNVICLEEKAFYSLFDKVIERVCEKQNATADKWLSPEEAMHLLRVKSKSTLQKLRDEGKIRGSHLGSRLVLYDRDSIMDYPPLVEVYKLRPKINLISLILGPALTLEGLL